MSGIKTDTCFMYWDSVVETMAEGLILIDTAGTVVFMNPAAERITGYTREEALGHRCDIFDSDTCRGCRLEEGSLACKLFESGCASGMRCSIRHKDGARVHVLKNARVLKDEFGNVIGGVETLADVSDLVEKDNEINGLRRELNRAYGFEGLVGATAVMRELYQRLAAAARSEAPVVLLGESGTGKELAAAAIHRRSQRADGPFLKVNCAALNESLLESELFGHEKGAFTGAEKARAGRFEAADGGSLFLDEIGDMPQALQVKLLRVLQEGEIERVGSNRTLKVNVRIISATNKNLDALRDEGSFREDLYYRINVIPIPLPPLRERKEDLPLLVQHFVERINLRTHQQVPGVSREALAAMMGHHWPGNVRELANALEFAFVSSHGLEISPEHLPPSIAMAEPAAFSSPSPAPQKAREPEKDMRRQIEEALAASGGRKGEAADILGVSRVTLWKRMKKLGMAD